MEYSKAWPRPRATYPSSVRTGGTQAPDEVSVMSVASEKDMQSKT